MSRVLEDAFGLEMHGIFERALSEANYKATRFLHMLHEHGGLETARILLHSSTVSEGYTALWERGRLDLTVEAVDHHAVDLASLRIREQTAQRGAIHIRAGIAAVVILNRQDAPALAGLAADLSLTGVPLGIERVEALFQSFLGGLPRVDCATDFLWDCVIRTRHVASPAARPAQRT